MNVFDNHVIEGEEGFQDAEDNAYVAGYEMYHTASKTQQATFQRHSAKEDNWQETVDLLIEVVNRTN